MERPSAGAGCLVSRVSVSGEHNATTSLLKRILPAPLMLPSPDLVTTRKDISLEELYLCVGNLGPKI